MPETERHPSRDVEAMLAYHRLSSLDPERPGAMPERLERRSQPIPFRRYAGAPRLVLPLRGHEETDGSGDARTTPDLERVARLFEDSLALAGWKRRAEAGFGLRIVPSAGNLHPLEAYLLASGLEGDGGGEESAALYHYSPFEHALERRRWLPADLWLSLRTARPAASIFIALSAIYWRCAWKYGERAFRLSHLDAGHAVAALDAAAALDGLQARWVDATGADLRRLLALGDSEAELADANVAETEDTLCLLALEPTGAPAEAPPWRPESSMLAALEDTPLLGEASRISERHRAWPGLLSAARASRRCGEAPTAPGIAPAKDIVPAPSPARPREVLRRRRSRAVYADRALGRRVFIELVDSLVGEAADSSFPSRDDLAVLLFVHRVEGVEPGLFAALDGRAHDVRAVELRGAMRADFEWRQIAVESRGWRLFRLSGGDARRAAAHLCAGQPAAGDGAFTALFLGRFEAMQRSGAWAYRRLHWQAGELGHRLYLAAEAEELGATGLGGFFDDRLRALLGLEGPSDGDWRPLYLLAVGHRGGEDSILEPPYAHRGTGAEPAPASLGGLSFPDEKARSPPAVQ